MADDDGHHRPGLFLPEPRSVIPVAGTLEVLGTFIKPLHAEATPGETLEPIRAHSGFPPFAPVLAPQ